VQAAFDARIHREDFPRSGREDPRDKEAVSQTRGTESRSTELGMLEPAQPRRLSATCGKSEAEMKVWWTRTVPVGTGSPVGCDRLTGL
jgi:hypothetical protein